MNEEKRRQSCRVMASNLPALRKSCGLTQSQFAELIGVSRSTVTAVERKKDMSWNVFVSSLDVLSRHSASKMFLGALDLDIAGIEEYLSSVPGKELC